MDGELRERVTIKRASHSTHNKLNEPAETWADSSTGIPARIQAIGGTEFFVDKQLVEATHRMFCRRDVDVTERDRVVDAVGAIYEVMLVQKTATGPLQFMRVLLKEIRTP